jgi:hypothetical protein
VSGIPKWGRSSKRRIRLIRWTAWEIASLTVIGGLIFGLCFLLAQWLARHPFD